MAYVHSLDEIFDRMRTDPHTWVREKSLSQLEAFVFGYRMALEANDIDSDDRTFSFRFLEFIEQRLGWNTSGGWAHAIAAHCSSADEAFDRFFSLLTAFRQPRASK